MGIFNSNKFKMYHVGKGLNSCCSGITDCIDSVCSATCKACHSCAEFIGKIFSRPFSFCVFLSVFITILPAFAGFYGYAIGEEPHCEPDMRIYLLINSVNLILIFIFCCYLCY